MSKLGKDDPLRILLAEIIDYAGLFPPAALPLEQTVANFADYKRWPESWMLGRLVLPAGKLDSFAAALSKTNNASKQWSISALVPCIEPEAGSQAEAFEAIVDFAKDHAGPGLVDTIECKVENVEQLNRSLSIVPSGIRVFWELPLGDQLESLVSAIAGLQKGTNGSAHNGTHLPMHCGKIRTGGVTPGAIPSLQDVARFIDLCAKHGVPFKATAGLHHPVRSEQALTYAADSPRAVLHGFLNVFLAATAAWTREASLQQIEDVLVAGHSESFILKSNELGVGEFEFTGDELNRARSEFAISFGSCSFAEPIDDLQNMDWLPVSARS